jgi:hypothetical protein
VQRTRLRSARWLAVEPERSAAQPLCAGALRRVEPAGLSTRHQLRPAEHGMCATASAHAKRPSPGGFALTVGRFGDRRRDGSTSPAALAGAGVSLRRDEVGRGHTFGHWGICDSGGRATEPCGSRRGRIGCGHSWHDVGRRHADGEDVEAADFELYCAALYFSPHLPMVRTKRKTTVLAASSVREI